MVELSRLQREVNQLFSAFVENNNPVTAPASGWDPSVDVVDDGETIRVLFELPGIEPGDVKVTVRGRSAEPRGAGPDRERDSASSAWNATSGPSSNRFRSRGP
jgi:HSP20 family molecular chaperone IbpA